MSSDERHIVITGSGGYIGSKLADQLLREPDFADCRITLLDLTHHEPPQNPRIRVVEGDFSDRATLDRAIDGHVDILFHLAGVLGGAAEADYDLSRRINVDGTLNLLERLRNEKPPRVVFASSIAVFGADMPAAIDDDTQALPTMVYGGQKRMLEIVIEQFSARGWIDGIALRLPGIVARPGSDGRLKSAFLNRIFFEYQAGRDFTMPVSADGTTWLISAHACVDALVHAARVPASALGRRRAFTLPAQRVEMQALVAALARRFPESRSTISYAPDLALEGQFARQPPLRTAIADALGFKHDGDISTLVARAL